MFVYEYGKVHMKIGVDVKVNVDEGVGVGVNVMFCPCTIHELKYLWKYRCDVWPILPEWKKQKQALLD